MPSQFIFGGFEPSSEASSNSTSVSEVNLTLTDVELLRLARAQARRRGRRAAKLRARSNNQEKSYQGLCAKFGTLNERRGQLERQLAQVNTELARVKGNLEDALTNVERVCVICLGAQPNYAFSPCGHVAVCEQCKNALQEQAERSRRLLHCPVCRRGVLMALKLYYA